MINHRKFTYSLVLGTLLSLSAATQLIFCDSANAADLETHSVYKVTTYDLGALLGEAEQSGLRIRNYEPLLITGTKSDILSGDPLKTTSLAAQPDQEPIKGFAIAAEYSATANFTVQGALGFAQNRWQTDQVSNEGSWEANLGLVYKFLDNLSYEIHFGYMETGDLFKERSTYSDIENIIMVSNKLTMSF
ncbi:hypothetical protein [Desulfosediminicola sp.]|uniref:hypothetical protein n=1 Tax=Desulfosediminicola sp. TaxID=2886825 RepID=UPI003AF2FF5B